MLLTTVGDIGVNFKKAFRLLLFTLLIVGSWSMGYVHAYSSEVVNNLNRTRDSLLDQRTHLQQRADTLAGQISELSRQLDVVNSYLRDTDKNIRDIDDALRRVN